MWLGVPGCAAFTLERHQLSHDVYENKMTYMIFVELTENCMRLMINNLSHRLGVGQGKKGNKKLRDSPTMLLKTKGNKNDNLTYPTISMKTKGLFFLSHDVYERKGS